MIERKADSLTIFQYDSRKEMGIAAARAIEDSVCKTLERKDYCNMIFAAAPSQNEVLAALAASTRINWQRVRAFHMDEYIGLSRSAPQGFANFLRRSLFDLVSMHEVFCLDSEADPDEECKRYTELLKKYPVDITCMGIGENGHIAFNDPPVADFHDPYLIKPVELDPVCRMQQVHDGCFSALADVPTHALSLTIPALLAASDIHCIVPASTKAQAIKNTVYGKINEACPASILRRHANAILYLDADSAALL